MSWLKPIENFLISVAPRIQCPPLKQIKIRGRLASVSRDHGFREQASADGGARDHNQQRCASSNRWKTCRLQTCAPCRHHSGAFNCVTRSASPCALTPEVRFGSWLCKNTLREVILGL